MTMEPIHKKLRLKIHEAEEEEHRARITNGSQTQECRKAETVSCISND